MRTNKKLYSVIGGLALTCTAACGGAGGSSGPDPDTILGLQAAEPKAGEMTDLTVHLTCKVIGVRDTAAAAVEYDYGIADENGVAQAPLHQVTKAGGFVDLTDLAPDTTYAVTFTAVLGDKKGAFAPSLT